MGVQVVHDKGYFLDVRVHDVHKVLDLMRPVIGRSVLKRTYMMPSTERFHKGEDATRPVPYVFGVNLLVVAGPHRPGFSRLSQQLIRLLVHADNGPGWVVWPFVDIEYVFHVSYEVRIRLRGKAPVV